MGYKYIFSTQIYYKKKYYMRLLVIITMLMCV